MNPNLELLNSFRAAEGLAPYKDWRPARHQSQLDTYMAAAAAEPMTSNASNLVEVAEEKIPTYKEFARYSSSAVVKPVEFVHAFLTENPGLARKQAIHILVAKHGVNYSTARTQYQRWFSAKKAK